MEHKPQVKGTPVLFQAAEHCSGGFARFSQFDYTMNGNLVADAEEFAHFEECMKESVPPSPSLVAGAALLKKLSR